jgi:hypothetical protein
MGRLRMQIISSVQKFVCTAAFAVTVAGSATLGMSSSARADTIGFSCSGSTVCTSVSPNTPFFTVTVAAGVSLLSAQYFTSSSSPAGPPNQGYQSSPNQLGGWVAGILGFSVTTVPNGDIPLGSDFTGLANILAIHIGGSGGKNEILLVFSALTGFSDISAGVSATNLNISNARAFVGGDVGLVPLPPAALLFGTALIGLSVLGRRRSKAGLA